MKLIKTPEEREVDMLQRVEKEIERREKRERVLRFVIAGLGVLAVASFLTGHCTGRGCRRQD